MKVGTDAVLLGAWCSVEGYPNSILDIGSGTGVIALMLAQRNDAQTIDAVEIDENAYEQTVANFEESDWGDRLFCYHATFQNFANEMAGEDENYDLIVSNPPFYRDAYQTESEARNKARFTSSLSFEELLDGVSKILSKNGQFSVIIPKKEQIDFVAIALKNGLFMSRLCNVKGTPSSEIKRILLTFSFQEKVLEVTELIIEIERHQYTDKYIDLTKDFYLKM